MLEPSNVNAAHILGKKKKRFSPTSLCDGIILDNLQNVVSRIKIRKELYAEAVQ